jgi:dTDP-4-amino-4,6-dideoxygalactose transaminase
MGGLNAAFLNRLLDELPAILTSRRETVSFYRERLAADSRVRVYGPPAGVIENGYLSVLTTPRKGADLVATLKAAGIGVAQTYPSTMDVQPPLAALGAICHGHLSVSKRFCDAVINLPLFYGIRSDEREAAVAALIAAL